ncbi:uncharacterized protein C1orf146 homolog isoform X1 [Rhinatrema bivittatum]|uniref:uncharacterized protein C1orf146 homolog isoform X1 n=1 Tax=Rhinatrema bivittatum TaxID=194408 RepID=UPI00112ADE55|nr:uncharacterized protein C1orf146 homolog isoform X1 [Rhinatrema bivittatum]
MELTRETVESEVKETARWKTTVILSSSLQNHEVAISLQSQHHRVRFSDSVEIGSIIFSLSGVAFLLVNTQQLYISGKDIFLERVEKFISIHRNSFLLLLAAIQGSQEWNLMLSIQQRFLGSNLRVIPINNTADIIKLMLTIAKATCKVHIDAIHDRILMAKSHIIEHSPIWKTLHKLYFDFELK